MVVTVTLSEHFSSFHIRDTIISYIQICAHGFLRIWSISTTSSIIVLQNFNFAQTGVFWFCTNCCDHNTVHSEGRLKKLPHWSTGAVVKSLNPEQHILNPNGCWVKHFHSYFKISSNMNELYFKSIQQFEVQFVIALKGIHLEKILVNHAESWHLCTL